MRITKEQAEKVINALNTNVIGVYNTGKNSPAIRITEAFQFNSNGTGIVLLGYPWEGSHTLLRNAFVKTDSPLAVANALPHLGKVSPFDLVVQS